MRKGAFRRGKLKLEIFKLLDAQMRPGQAIPDVLNCVLEINNVGMQGMAHATPGKGQML